MNKFEIVETELLAGTVVSQQSELSARKFGSMLSKLISNCFRYYWKIFETVLFNISFAYNADIR